MIVVNLIYGSSRIVVICGKDTERYGSVINSNIQNIAKTDQKQMRP